MKNAKKMPETLWAVVLVESGVPTLVEAYRDRKTANKRKQLLREGTSEEYDAVGMFEVTVDSQAAV